MNEDLDNTQASPVHHDFTDEDPPFAPTSPFPHDPMNEGFDNARFSSPYRMKFELDYLPNSPPFKEHIVRVVRRIMLVGDMVVQEALEVM
jgi:hypothetical protein